MTTYSLTTRAAKGSPLTTSEMDNNLISMGHVVENVADLRAITYTPAADSSYSTLGYTTAGDGGNAGYRWHSTSTDADDGVLTIKITAVTTGRFKLIYSGAIDVRWAGANSTSDIGAVISTIYAALPSTGGGIFIPPQLEFQLTTALSITGTKPISIFGSGQFASKIRPTFAGGDAITFDGPARVEISNLFLQPTVDRNSGTYLIRIKNCTYPTIRDVHISNGQGGQYMIETCNFLNMSGCQGDSTTGTSGDTALRIKGSGGTVSNCYFRVGQSSGYPNSTPCLWISGQTTSLHISNSGFAGGGPAYRYTTSGGSSTATDFTINVPTGHKFKAGDLIVFRNMTPSGYNNQFRLASVTATSVTVTSTLNPGAVTVNGTAEFPTACGYVTNEDGPVNESSIVGCLFEGFGVNEYGSAALWFNARAGAYEAQQAVSGWRLTGNYYDFGSTGLLLTGARANTGPECSLSGFVASDGIFVQPTRGVHLEQVTGVCLSNFVGGGSTHTTDKISSDTAIYIYAGDVAPFTQGVSISNSHLGYSRNWYQDTAKCYSYGIILDGQTIQDLSVSNCEIYGNTLSVGETGSPNQPGNRWRFKNNTVWGASLPLGVIPSVASGNTINVNPYNDIQKITGTTNIQNINPAVTGQELTLVFVSALSLITGGNLAIAANYAVAAGQLVKLVFDGTSWYLK